MNSKLWTEKYRPKIVDELDVPDHIKNFLRNAIKNGHPHLLLYGPPGTGKTSFASLLNPTFSLNASDERGIDVIRNKIKKISNSVNKQVIVLDECENLTKDSQTCLRRILEDYPNTSFIFCTNYLNRVILPLQSRLLKIRFNVKHTQALKRIANNENIKISDKICEELLRKCSNDLRRSINVLQGIKPLIHDNKENEGYNNNEKGNENNNIEPEIEEIIDEFIGRIREETLRCFLEITPKNYKEFIEEFIGNSYNVLQLLYQLNEITISNDIQKAKFSMALSELEQQSINGCLDELVLNCLCFKKIEILG